MDTPKKIYICWALDKRFIGNLEWFEVEAIDLAEAKENARRHCVALAKKRYEEGKSRYSIDWAWDWEIFVIVAKDNCTQLHDKIHTYPEGPKDFLLEHLGFFEDKLVLAKRINVTWRKRLEKDNVLRLVDYVYMVEDLDMFIESYLKRTSRKKPYPTDDPYGDYYRYPITIKRIIPIIEENTSVSKQIITKQRGGKRKGAGRKALGITKKVSLTLSEETWEQLEVKCKDSNSKLSKVLREMIENTND